MNMELFNVHLRTPGRKVIFKGKTSRTPVTFEKVGKEDIKYLKIWMDRESITDFSIEPFKPQHVQTSVVKKGSVDEIKPNVEELEEPKSTIERLLRESE
jgi:hypothetical protein